MKHQNFLLTELAKINLSFNVIFFLWKTRGQISLFIGIIKLVIFFTGANIDESVIRQYLTTSSSEGEESDLENTEDNSGDVNEDNVAKYRALLAEIDKPKEEKEMEMEVTWRVGLKGILFLGFLTYNIM